MNNSIAQVRSEPATEKQKEKLRYFGYSLKDGMTKGEASDALDECAKEFPQKDAEYYNRPATEEQLTKLREINAQCETDEPFYDFEEEVALTYGKAKDLIQEWGWLERQNEREQDNAYLKSDESKIDEMWMRIEDEREVTREQVASAYAVVKLRIADKTQTPDQTEIEDTLEELFTGLRNDGKSYPVYRCNACAAMFKARPVGVGAINFSSGVFSTKEDIVPVIISCPSCGQDNKVGTLKVCKYICPNCSKECLVAKSQTGQSVKHFSSECMKEFFASPSEALNAGVTVRLMQYAN